MRAFIHALLLAAALMPFGLRQASAQAGEVLLELLAQCRPDIADFCSDVQPGGGRVAACLYSRTNDLSRPCRRAMRDGIALRACGSEARRYCGDIAPGDGVARCLRDYREELSPRCQDALASLRSEHRDRRDYTRNDDPPRYATPYIRKPQPDDVEDGEDGEDGVDGDLK